MPGSADGVLCGVPGCASQGIWGVAHPSVKVVTMRVWHLARARILVCPRWLRVLRARGIGESCRHCIRIKRAPPTTGFIGNTDIGGTASARRQRRLRCLPVCPVDGAGRGAVSMVSGGVCLRGCVRTRKCKVVCDVAMNLTAIHPLSRSMCAIWFHILTSSFAWAKMSVNPVTRMLS